MSPSKKKRKGKERHPPPRYRKQRKAGSRHARRRGAEPGPATPPVPVAAPPAPREPARPRTGRVVGLDPLAPIIVRSGRPMNHTDADPAQFPPPSTIAGCLRTAWARATGRPFDPELAQLAVGGPLLVDEDGRVLAPKPADALYFGHATTGKKAPPRCLRAAPRPFRALAATQICPRGCGPCN